MTTAGLTNGWCNIFSCVQFLPVSFFFGWRAFLTSCFMKVQNPSERMDLKWVEELFAESVGGSWPPGPEGSFPVWPAVTVTSPPQLFHTLLLIPGVGSKWNPSKCVVSVPSFTLKMTIWPSRSGGGSLVKATLVITRLRSFWFKHKFKPLIKFKKPILLFPFPGQHVYFLFWEF